MTPWQIEPDVSSHHVHWAMRRDKSQPLKLWHDGGTYKVDKTDVDWDDDIVEVFISINDHVNVEILFDSIHGPCYHEHNCYNKTTLYDSTVVAFL
jgi:hypothetical protein